MPAGHTATIVAFTNILFEKGIPTPDQVARKVDDVTARFKADTP
jgi:hypothetical protein